MDSDKAETEVIIQSLGVHFKLEVTNMKITSFLKRKKGKKNSFFYKKSVHQRQVFNNIVDSLHNIYLRRSRATDSMAAAKRKMHNARPPKTSSSSIGEVNYV